MTVRTLRCTDRAYEALLAMYGTDNAVWTAVGAIRHSACMFGKESPLDGEQALRGLCHVHGINPHA